MKNLALYVLMAFALLLSNDLMAQAKTCCGTGVVAPEVATGVNTVVKKWEPTSAATLAVPATGLPNTEYLILKKGTLAGSDPNGDMILGSSVDGVFIPDTLNKNGFTLAENDTFDLVAVGFDLQQVKTLGDSLINGVFASNGASCCGIFDALAKIQRSQDPTGFTSDDSTALSNFCDTMSARGITNSNDISNLGDVLVIFEAFSDTSLSVESLVDVLETINQNGTSITTDCGGTGSNNFLKYGVNPSKRSSTPVPVERLGKSETAFMVFPNPAGEFVHVYVTTKEAADLTVNVYSTIGAKVHSHQLNNVVGNEQMTVDVSNFAAGVYYVELTDGLNKDIQKVIVR
ncbi:MAG: T9SS type A sorting domain-containing protein [Aureispira sp.]|nr:T9SS type A sorting domain-containing protein [Aureispira sp.]